MLILSAMLFLTEHIAVGMINAMAVECEFGVGVSSGAGGSADGWGVKGVRTRGLWWLKFTPVVSYHPVYQKYRHLRSSLNHSIVVRL